MNSKTDDVMLVPYAASSENHTVGATALRHLEFRVRLLTITTAATHNEINIAAETPLANK